MGFTHVTRLAHITYFMSYNLFIICCTVTPMGQLMDLGYYSYTGHMTVSLIKYESPASAKKAIYVRRTQPASGRIASALWVPCALTVRRMFFLIPCAWCLPTPLSPLPCTQRACCGRPLSRHPPHPSPLLLLSSDGIRLLSTRMPSSHFYLFLPAHHS